MAKSKTIGATIKLSGEKEYRKAVTDINSSMKVLVSEMKKSTAEFGDNAKGLKALKEQTSQTAEKVELQKKKVETLRGALEQSKEKYGENAKKTKEWQISLNNAEAELAKMTRQLDDLKSQTTGINKIKNAFADMKSKISDIKDKCAPVTDGFKKIASAGAKIAKLSFKAVAASVAAVGTAAVAAGKAIVNIAKASLESYGDYEQLVGGVETLFKKSSKEVLNYANNAYKTAGLTANEYMETVTSFSASLLQSLNGDTAKAAKVADMAITDMSDNANKMGSDMSLIQNAYQGFAKQNYTMLDNLKLGYGGTKEEMQRLLDDAEKLSGTKYDISNLNDVYQAIHVIQTNLGITGTTAKEASTTIQGSINAVKSTFKNLITGLADKKANISQLVNNFVDSVKTAATNIVPVITTVVKNIGPAISQTVSTLLPELVDLATELINSLVQTISENLKPVVDAAITIVTTLANALLEDDTLTAIIDAALHLIESIVGMLQNPDSLQKLINAAIKIVFSIAQGLIEMTPQIIDAGLQLVKGLIKGIWDNRSLIWNKIKELGRSIIKAIKDIFGIHSPSTVFSGIGKNLIQGLINGIQNSVHLVINKVREVAGNVVSTMKNMLGIHSPSKVFDELGDYTGQGFGQGFVKSMKKVREKIKDVLPTTINSDVGLKLKTSVQANLNKIDSMVTGTPSINNSTSNKVFNFNINMTVNSNVGSSDSDLKHTAEELSRELYKNIKRRMEAFA